MDINDLLDKSRAKTSSPPKKVMAKRSRDDEEVNDDSEKSRRHDKEAKSLDQFSDIDESKQSSDKPVVPEEIAEAPASRKGATVESSESNNLILRDADDLKSAPDAETIRLLDFLARSEFGLREIRIATHLLARTCKEGNGFLPYTNKEIEQATFCHFSHVSTSMNSLEKFGFIERTKPKLSTVKKCFRIIW
ncbi:MAG: hypothetical protein EOP48_02755 [Sphingobacteriales bacterium]|nr:MAG: hypothetical protein EOP48_02755 [Sphingobacteriales bacterium]